MNTLKKWARYSIALIGSGLVVVTMLSLITNSSLWYFKVLEFPRLTILIALLLVLVLYALLHRKWTLASGSLLLGLMAAVFVQAAILFPYTPVASQVVPSATLDEPGNVVGIVVANVFMKNRRYDEFIQLIQEKDPAIVLAMEVDSRWTSALSTLHLRYPHRILVPNDNTYGMALYSKYPLRAPQTLYLNEKGVPSIVTRVELPDGAEFRFMAVHPVPPKPSEYPDNIGEKEVALMKAARLVADEKVPTVVAGDFNDVGWSYNSRKFEEMSQLHDIRRGRGLFNTFDATSFFLRWPLDYVYVSSQFQVLEVERLNDVGSDHFPYYVKVLYP